MASVLTLLSLLVGVVRGLGNNEDPTQLQRSCQHAGRVYVEGDEVLTAQPCLNCTCSRGSLVCYRRMCPETAATPPRGCRLTTRHGECCPSLVCGDTTTQPTEPDIPVLIPTTVRHLKISGNDELESTLAEPPGNEIDLQKRDMHQGDDEARSYHQVGGPVARSAPVAQPATAENSTANDAADGSTTEAEVTTSTTTTAAATTTTTTETTTDTPTTMTTTTAAAATTTTVTAETTTNAPASEPPHTTTTTTAAAAATTTSAAVALRREDEDADGPSDTTLFMTSQPTTVIIPEDMYVTDITLRKNVSIAGEDGNTTSRLPVRTIPPHIEALINISHKKDEDYDAYDYGAPPSLPPSLPNVKIIPFVAADAVLENGEDKATAYPMQDKHLPTDNPLYSRFSPPIKTEGGFQPREPILDGPFYESKLDGPYDTTGHLQLDITSGTLIPPSITILPKSEEKVCYSDGQEYGNGELLSEPGACLVCICHHGEVFCQDTKCPALAKGCTRVKEKRTTCCGRVVCEGDEFPTVVLAGVGPPITVAEGLVTTLDPFRDVIRTEPAPDLPSLIGDLKPYLLERHSTTGSPSSTTRRPTSVTHAANRTTANATQPSPEDGPPETSSLLDSVFHFLFAGETTAQPSRGGANGSIAATAVEKDQPAATEALQPVEATTVGNLSAAELLPGAEEPLDEQPDPGAASGILKLAGCNIYGRMYRVGRIISELSTPCLECMCTEVGVQCRQLKC